jgi:hypothetical protein
VREWKKNLEQKFALFAAAKKSIGCMAEQLLEYTTVWNAAMKAHFSWLTRKHCQKQLEKGSKSRQRLSSNGTKRKNKH